MSKSGLSVDKLVVAARAQGICFMKYKREPERLSLVFLKGYKPSREMVSELKERKVEVLSYVKTLPPFFDS